MTTLDQIQTSIRRHAEGVGSSVAGIGAQCGTLELRVVRGADERAVQMVFTPEIEVE